MQRWNPIIRYSRDTTAKRSTASFASITTPNGPISNHWIHTNPHRIYSGKGDMKTTKFQSFAVDSKLKHKSSLTFEKVSVDHCGVSSHPIPGSKVFPCPMETLPQKPPPFPIMHCYHYYTNDIT